MWGYYYIDPEKMERGQVREIDYGLPKRGDGWWNIKDNFSEENYSVDILTMIGYQSLILMITMRFTALHKKYNDKKNPLYNYLLFIVCIILTICIFINIYLNYGNDVICEYPKWCNEGINNKIISSNYYYRLYGKDCPKYYSWLKYMYEDENNNNDNCEDTVYGCCEMWDIKCPDAIQYNNTFTEYQNSIERNISHWMLMIEKINPEGINCPTIEDIIYDVSIEYNYHYDITNYIVNTIIYFVLLICLYGYSFSIVKKEKYKEVKTNELQGSV